jgi:hypothetical protein
MSKYKAVLWKLALFLMLSNIKDYPSTGQAKVMLKGQYHEIFNPRFFQPPKDPGLQAKAVLHMASNSPRNSR